MSKILILAFDKMELLPNVEIMEVCAKLHDFRIAQVQQYQTYIGSCLPL